MKTQQQGRLDQVLVELGLAPTRSKAQQLIEAGDVEVFARGEWRQTSQASLIVAKSSGILRVKENTEILKYVSRGGLKLEGALNHLGLNVEGRRCLDLGISTGGFADCLLKNGAAEVCGVDVGHGQLHPQLASDGRVKLFEGVNVKDVRKHAAIMDWLNGGVDLCVADLSFISLLSVVHEIKALLPARTQFLGLVKPQFELGAAALNKSGVVADHSLFTDLEAKALQALPGAQFFASPITGQDGNVEFFLYSNGR